MLVELNTGREHLLLGFIPFQGFPARPGVSRSYLRRPELRGERQEPGMFLEAQAWAQ